MLAAVLASQRNTLDVVDKNGHTRCKVQTTAVYETIFGDPAQSMVREEEYGDDAECFRRDLSVWAAEMEAAGHPLTDKTVLIVEEFDVVSK